MKPLETFSSRLYRILRFSGKYLFGIFMYYDVYMVVHKKKSFVPQITNQAPSFVYEITLLTKSLVSNIEAAGEPASRA